MTGNADVELTSARETIQACVDVQRENKKKRRREEEEEEN